MNYVEEVSLCENIIRVLYKFYTIWLIGDVVSRKSCFKLFAKILSREKIATYIYGNLLCICVLAVCVSNC